MTREELEKALEWSEANGDHAGVKIQLHAIGLHNTIDDLAMLVKRLCHAMEVSPDGLGHGVIKQQAMGYLTRHGLDGRATILRVRKTRDISVK